VKKTEKKKEETAAEGLIALDELRKESNLYLEVLEDYDIPDDTEYEAAGEFASLVHMALQKTEAEYKRSIATFKEEIAKRDALFKPVIKQLKESKARVKAIIGGYVLKKSLEQRELAEAAMAAPVTATGSDSAAALMRSAREAGAPVLEGVSGAIKRRIRVIDADLVPDEYTVRVVDEAALQAAVDKGVKSIPGCEIYEDVAVRVTGKKSG
jgi:hypothetical protein